MGLADVICAAPYHLLPHTEIKTGANQNISRNVPIISAAKAYYSKPKPHK